MSDNIVWETPSIQSVSSEPGWVRGTPVKYMAIDNEEWLVVVFKDKGKFWFRAGAGINPLVREPVFYGPYETLDEAERTSQVMLRLGVLL